MNLISKRIGINDHFPIDNYSKAMFPENEIYNDVIKTATEKEEAKYGKCMKNVYRSDEWIKAWLKHSWNKEIGKKYAYYVYNVDYDGIGKPVKKYIDNKDENILYQRANGVMYYDFDNIGKDVVDIIEKSFDRVSYKNHCFQWFERSWSGNGCHIRIKYNLKFKTKAEWQFVYMHYLNELMRAVMLEITKNINVEKWYSDNTIDWSCATITRGFAIPYNEQGVHESEYFEDDFSMPYKDKEQFQILVESFCFGWWHKYIKEKFLHNINHQTYNENNSYTNVYGVEGIDLARIKEQSGEKFDYNWRLKCVTTLMNIYEGDKDKVRNACKLIYHFIKPYKNHTYEEMIGYELEQKIFANGDMSYHACDQVIKDLEKYFGFKIKKQIKVNEAYVDDLLLTIFKNR